MKIPLPSQVALILDTLNKNGYEGYIVGGCVRDCLMEKTPKDWDITTSAKPSEVKKLFSHTYDTGIEHGTVTVVLENENYEVTTYRIEGDYKDCRHPEQVIFTRELTEDLLRRDFTMNAIAYHPKEDFIDPFFGQIDISNKIIRGVGQPSERFQEDALRMLRAARFSVQLGFSIEDATKKAIHENASLIEKISAERIREELTKLLMGDYLMYLPVLWETDLLKYISPTIEKGIVSKKEELIKQLERSPKIEAIRWTIFLQSFTAQQAKEILKKLKFDTKTLRLITTLLDQLHSPFSLDRAAIKKQVFSIGKMEYELLLETKIAIESDPNIQIVKKIYSDMIQKQEPLFLNDLAINGNDLIQTGIPKGKRVGEILNYLIEFVHQQPDKNTKEILLHVARKQNNDS